MKNPKNPQKTAKNVKNRILGEAVTNYCIIWRTFRKLRYPFFRKKNDFFRLFSGGPYFRNGDFSALWAVFILPKKGYYLFE
jgi:hypothetical protein